MTSKGEALRGLMVGALVASSAGCVPEGTSPQEGIPTALSPSLEASPIPTSSPTAFPSETATATPTPTETPIPTLVPSESGMRLEGVSQVHHLGDAWLAYDSQGIPIFEYNQRQGVWETFEPERGMYVLEEYPVPEWLLSPLSVEATERQGLRFTSGGEPLSYGYLGYWDWDTDSINPGWYADDPGYQAGETAHNLVSWTAAGSDSKSYS